MRRCRTAAIAATFIPFLLLAVACVALVPPNPSLIISPSIPGRHSAVGVAIGQYSSSSCHRPAALSMTSRDDAWEPRGRRRIGRFFKRVLRRPWRRAGFVSDAATGPVSAVPKRGRKRAAAKKLAVSLAVSISLLYSPTIRPSRSDGPVQFSRIQVAQADDKYDFSMFKDSKGKVSLAPGIRRDEFEVLEKKADEEGTEAVKGELEALRIGTDIEEEIKGGAEGKRVKASRKQKKQTKQQAQDEWIDDEFGSEGDDDDEFGDMVELGSESSKRSKRKGKGGESDKAVGGKKGGGVRITDRSAYNKYTSPVPKKQREKNVVVGVAKLLAPFWAALLIRGQVRNYKERVFVRKGMAIIEEQKQEYLKKKAEGKTDEDEEDEDEEDEDEDENGDAKGGKNEGKGDDDDEDDDE